MYDILCITVCLSVVSAVYLQCRIRTQELSLCLCGSVNVYKYVWFLCFRKIRCLCISYFTMAVWHTKSIKFEVRHPLPCFMSEWWAEPFHCVTSTMNKSKLLSSQTASYCKSIITLSYKSHTGPCKTYFTWTTYIDKYCMLYSTLIRHYSGKRENFQPRNTRKRAHTRTHTEFTKRKHPTLQRTAMLNFVYHPCLLYILSLDHTRYVVIGGLSIQFHKRKYKWNWLQLCIKWFNRNFLSPNSRHLVRWDGSQPCISWK